MGRLVDPEPGSNDWFVKPLPLGTKVPWYVNINNYYLLGLAVVDAVLIWLFLWKW